MIRQTSIDVYNEIKENGLLSQLRFEVYDAIFNNGPLTQGETWLNHFRNIRQRHSIAPRFAELEERGVIAVVGEKSCQVTGNNCLLWDVTADLPRQIKKAVRIECEHCDGKGYVEIRSFEDLIG